MVKLVKSTSPSQTPQPVSNEKAVVVLQDCPGKHEVGSSQYGYDVQFFGRVKLPKSTHVPHSSNGEGNWLKSWTYVHSKSPGHSLPSSQKEKLEYGSQNDGNPEIVKFVIFTVNEKLNDLAAIKNNDANDIKCNMVLLYLVRIITLV